MTRELASRPFAMVRRKLVLALLAYCFAGVMTSTASAQTGAAAGAAATTNSMPNAAQTENSASPLANQSMLYPGEDFKLAPGDLITVEVFLQPEYHMTVRVGLDGSVQLPFIGSVHVEGLTVRAAQTLIADRLRVGEFYANPEVTIQVLDTVNSTVIVTGEVRATVPVSSQRSLREVLLVAGGLPATASHTVKIVRPGVADPIVVELGTDLASSTSANFPVQPHDIIQISFGWHDAHLWEFRVGDKPYGLPDPDEAALDARKIRLKKLVDGD